NPAGGTGSSHGTTEPALLRTRRSAGSAFDEYFRGGGRQPSARWQSAALAAGENLFHAGSRANLPRAGTALCACLGHFIRRQPAFGTDELCPALRVRRFDEWPAAILLRHVQVSSNPPNADRTPHPG